MSNYLEVEKRVQEALDYKQAHPDATLRFLAGQFHASIGRIFRRLHDHESRSTRPPTNQKLNGVRSCIMLVY